MSYQQQPVVYAPAAASPRYPRHALGLPAGSVRALLALGILGLLWLIALRPIYGQKEPLVQEKLPLVFVYLQFLMVLILAHFFAAHGGSIGPHISTRSPLGLPRGSVRFLLLAGYLGLAAYLYHLQPEFEVPPTGPFVLLLLILTSGFFLGHVLTGLVRRGGGGVVPPWFQDIEAWVAILALCVLGIILVVQLVINPTLIPADKLDIPGIESVLAGLVGFYFGARS